MSVETRADREYIVLTPLIEVGVRPEYVWTLMGELVLTIPDWDEFKRGAAAIVREILDLDEVNDISIRSTRGEIWIKFN